MYYRRKVLLSFLEIFEGKLEKIRFQKLLFLLRDKQTKPSFDFVPYKFGCFSFQSYADLRTMIKYELVGELETDSGEFWKRGPADGDRHFVEEILPADRQALLETKSVYGHLTSDELVALTYRQYPYYAIRSEIARNVLTEDELLRVRQETPSNMTPTLFTIGYEGKSIEAYFNALIKNNVKVLCDVRNNPVSMKYGFSRTPLERTCTSLGIKYVHIPELGIVSEKRKNLKTPSDYGNLFAEYERSTLSSTASYQRSVMNLLESEKRVALTCFEADPTMCHRMRLTKALTQLPNWQYEIIHL